MTTFDLPGWPLMQLYGSLSGLERRFFETFPFLVHQARAKVISVGNLTVGGTGKTPVLMELLARHSPGEKVLVLTRGYKSPWERGSYLVIGKGPHPAELTDETLLVHQRFPHIPILLGKNRAHNARLGQSLFALDTIYLDDGFQYRRLKKDIDLVLWDATDDPDEARLLPMGRLREPLERLGAASAILLTRCESVSSDILQKRIKSLRRHGGDVPVLEMETVPAGWLDPMGRHTGSATFFPKVFAFAAIGNPESFVRQLKNLGLPVCRTKWFRDHHHFSMEELNGMLAEARGECATLVCTEKDRVKIPSTWSAASGLFSLLISVIPRERELFYQILGEGKVGDT